MLLRQLRYADLVSRDGEKCAYCNTVDRLQIHHKNRNTADNRLENLALACPSCNSKEYWKWLKAHLAKPETSESESERERASFSVAGTDASGELTLAPTLWEWWLAWMKTRILRDGYVSVHDAIYSVARELKEKYGYGSSVTTRRYLKEAASDPRNGDFERKRHATLGYIVVFTEKMEQRLELGVQR
jgi:HNH endonuclease